MNNELIEYIKRTETIDKLKAIIIGQDPYPNSPSGIAFCKETFEELFYKDSNYHCCGQYVLYSLGITEKAILNHKEKFQKPVDVFYYLLENKIAVINICYEILDAPFIAFQKTIDFNRKLFEKNENAILKAAKLNKPLIEKAEKIFILGKHKTLPIFERFYNEFIPNETLIHPSNYNAQKKETIQEWKSVWNTKYLINKIL